MEVDASKGLGAGEAADDEPGLRVNHRGGDLAVGSDRQFPVGEVAYQQAMVQRLPGPDGCGAIQLDVYLARVERLTGRRVRAFHSSIDTNAEGMAIETFVLHPEGYDGPSRTESADR